MRNISYGYHGSLLFLTFMQSEAQMPSSEGARAAPSWHDPDSASLASIQLRQGVADSASLASPDGANAAGADHVASDYGLAANASADHTDLSGYRGGAYAGGVDTMVRLALALARARAWLVTCMEYSHLLMYEKLNEYSIPSRKMCHIFIW